MSFHRYPTVVLFGTLAFALFQPLEPADAAPLRKVVLLDGTWQIGEGNMADIPAAFDRSVTVPGLVSMATPAFDAPGPKDAKRDDVPQKDPKRDAFWYRRTLAMNGSTPVFRKRSATAAKA
jgi:hypothetical protein